MSIFGIITNTADGPKAANMKNHINSCNQANAIENGSNPKDVCVKSTYSVQYAMRANSSPIMETADETSAKAEFAKQRDQLASNTPADVSGWTDEDQAWRDVYCIRLLRIDFDESGEVVDMETIDETPYYFN